jgi:hypothetical protein
MAIAPDPAFSKELNIRYGTTSARGFSHFSDNPHFPAPTPGRMRRQHGNRPLAAVISKMRLSRTLGELRNFHDIKRRLLT